MMTSIHLKGHLFERAVDALMLTLIASLALGLPLGDLYRDHGEITQMSILLQVGEEESADYISRVLYGDEPEIEVGIGLLSPKYRMAQERVVEIPEYVRRRFLASAVEPFVYRIPKVSVIEVELLVEGEPMQAHTFDLGMEPLHSDLIYKNLNFTLEDPSRFREAVEESARLHGGEVELTLRGRARTHYQMGRSIRTTYKQGSGGPDDIHRPQGRESCEDPHPPRQRNGDHIRGWNHGGGSPHREDADARSRQLIEPLRRLHVSEAWSIHV